MGQSFNNSGVLFSYQEFLQHYEIPVTPKQFAIVFGAISAELSMLFKSCISNFVPNATPVDVTVSSIGEVCFNLHGSKNNRKIRALFQDDSVSISPSIFYWNCFVNNLC